ncbi:MAG: ATP-binding protein, partial [Pseudomonadota bacterium]
MKPARELTPQELYRACDPQVFDFTTTENLEDLTEMIGQERAVEAVQFGADVDLHGYNLFVLGPSGTGRHTFIKRFLKEKATEEETPSDWVYVNNFADSRQPRVLELPAGEGTRLRDRVARLIEESHRVIPAAFESDDYRERRKEIERRAQEEQEKAFEEVREHARERGIGIKQAATGFSFVPLVDGKELSPKEYGELPRKERERLQQDTEEIAQELQKMLQAIPKRVREVFEEIHELDRRVALFAVGNLIDELRDENRALPKVVEHLESLRQDIVDNIRLFRGEEESRQPLKMMLGGGQSGEPESTPLQRYAVNVLISRGNGAGAPVIFADEPSFHELVGAVEYKARMGTMVTDFTLLKPGALHRANGGYLVMDARKLLVQPYAWEGLKQALKACEVRIRSLGQVFSLVSTVSLEPEPIPLDVKVVLVGERLIYYLLKWYDPEFSELFRVAADFDDRM